MPSCPPCMSHDEESQKQDFSARPSIWDELSGRIPSQEIEEVRRIVGVRNVEACELLHQEIQSLLEILKEVVPTRLQRA